MTGVLGEPFVLIKSEYTKSEKACDHGEKHWVYVVHDRAVVRLVETKPATDVYSSTVIDDAGWRVESEDGRSFYCNWEGMVDPSGYCGIYSWFHDEDGNPWHQLKWSGPSKAYTDTDSNLLAYALLSDPTIQGLDK